MAPAASSSRRGGFLFRLAVAQELDGAKAHQGLANFTRVRAPRRWGRRSSPDAEHGLGASLRLLLTTSAAAGSATATASSSRRRRSTVRLSRGIASRAEPHGDSEKRLVGCGLLGVDLRHAASAHTRATAAALRGLLELVSTVNAACCTDWNAFPTTRTLVHVSRPPPSPSKVSCTRRPWLFIRIGASNLREGVSIFMPNPGFLFSHERSRRGDRLQAECFAGSRNNLAWESQHCYSQR